MKTLIFTLTMPGNNSWNGRWSGEGNLYAAKRTVKESKAEELSGRAFPHNFGDGWWACVSVRLSEGSSDTRQTMKKSRGFCGYGWMIDNIIAHGSTYNQEDSK